MTHPAAGLSHVWRCLLLGCLATLLAVADLSADPAEASSANAVVGQVIEQMPRGGGYVWKSTGVPHTIRHDGQVILEKTSADGTYCSGVTFTVVMEAARRLDLLRDVPAEQVKQFQRHWYGTDAASAETQCVYAMQQLGVGQAVEPEDARPGDFVQFWREKSGHSVVFLDWIRDEQGQRQGLRYWSSQKATDGMGVHREWFRGSRDAAGKEGSVDPDRLYIGRLNDRPTN